MNLESLKTQGLALLETLMGWLASPQFYAQVIAILASILIARIVAKQLRAAVPILRDEPTEGRLFKLQHFAYSCRDLLPPLANVAALAIAAAACDAAVGSSWLVRSAQSAAVIYVLYAAINRFINHPVLNAAARWIGIPIAAISVFGYLDDLMLWLDSLAFVAGNIRISVLALLKAAGFGGVLFWLGRMSTTAGQKVIREQQSIDIQTRELASKFFEISVFVLVAFLLMNILGLDLTALAVFGGALGVGLGFGLQQIAANFISGIIILLERSIKVGDFIELENGKAGILREINMRSSALETFDGKDIMVPNEKFITTHFVNWTKTDPHQRYEVPFAVSYDTDLHRVPELIEKAVSSHPGVLQSPEAPDCELRGFGDNGVNFAIEFWVSGIDDGKNKFSSDVHFLVWDALKAAGISMPFPQREIRIISDQPELPNQRKAKP